MKHLRWFLLCLALLAPTFFPAIADEPKSKSVAAELKPFVDRHSLAGVVVLAADKNKILVLEAVGYADIEHNTLMKTDALFWIASQSKPITAVGLMLLVDEGKVNLDDPVEKYLPEFKDIKLNGQKPKTTITVRHLLAHTSGMPFKSAEEQPTLDKLTLQEAVQSYVNTPMIYEPGTKYVYSNAGINSAGRIIEVVSGMPYEIFMDKRLFEPLGMKDTTFWPSESQLKRLAHVYRPDAAKKALEATTIAQLKYPLSDRKRQPMPAGGLFSTATDVCRFCQMMLNNGTFEGKKILTESAVKEMTKRQTDESIPTNYGLGFALGADTFGHGGALSTNMTVDTKRGLVTVFLVQHAGFPGDGSKAQAVFRKAAEERSK